MYIYIYIYIYMYVYVYVNIYENLKSPYISILTCLFCHLHYHCQNHQKYFRLTR